MWKKPPPPSQFRVKDNGDSSKGKQVSVKRAYRSRQKMEEEIRAEFGCHICKKVLSSPVTTPCAHNFCKACLQGAFAGVSHIKERTCEGRRTLRPRKNAMNCPLCSSDIAEFLRNLEVNIDLMNAIQEMQQKLENLEEEKGDDEEKSETEESLKIDNAEKESADNEATSQQASEEKQTGKRKALSNENVDDSEAALRRNKKGKSDTGIGSSSSGGSLIES